jgi:hypothetical protein
MGILDDAIREHLDLKRRRGADPTEVERAEREALGPVKRSQTQPDSELEEPLETDAGDAYDDDEEEDWTYEDEAGEVASDRLDEAPAPAVPDADEGPGPVPFDRDEDPFADADFEPARGRSSRRSAAEPEEPEDPEEAAPPPPAGDETTAFDVESAFEAEDPPAGEDPKSAEDVLEETPEFLQDTPDHDRLWFEQRPPKDFDFDG